MLPTRAIPALLALLLLLAACSGTTTSSSEAPESTAPTDAPPAATEPGTDATDAGGDAGTGDLDACLNTVEEVAAAFGVEVLESENTQAIGGTACDYRDEAGAVVMAIFLNTGEDAQFTIDAMETYVADGSAVEVSGIGDQAWFNADTFLVVAKGDAVLRMNAGIAVAAFGDPSVRPILEDLARSAAERMQ